jgi:IclR family transcriptional regulator, KDG regulon repressor
VVQSVIRAIQILSLLGNNPGLSVTQVSEQLQFPKSSTHDLLTTLEAEYFVQREKDLNRYHLSIRLFELGNLALGDFGIRKISEPFIRRLNELLDETVHLTVLENDEVLYIDCLESKKRLRTYSVIGIRAPLHNTAVGKAILAVLPEPEVDRIIREKGLEKSTAKTIVDPMELKKALKATLKRGYSIDDSEHEDGVRCVGAPLMDYSGHVVGSISASGPTQRLEKEELPRIGRTVADTALEISRRLGFKPSGGTVAAASFFHDDAGVSK